MVNPNDFRSPPIVRLPNSAMGGGTYWCPHDGFRMIYDRINLNNYVCPHCNYELPLQQNSNPDITTIATIDGWVDQGLANTGTKTAKMRPVEGQRKDAVVQARFHPILHPDMNKFTDRGITITSSETKMDRPIDTLDVRKQKYSAKVRRKQYL